MLAHLQSIYQQFKLSSEIITIKEIKSGHINDTYLISTQDSKQYILQKINSNTFKDVKSLMTNKQLISEHLLKQYKNTAYQAVEFIEAISGDYYIIDNYGHNWNMMVFIPDSITHEVAINKEMVYEAGKLFGSFITETASIPTNKVKETLPDFHNMLYRYLQFDQALENASNEAKINANDAIKFALNLKEEMCELSNLKLNNKFPLRITHNDAKLSNILFNDKNKGIAVIDLDTVMPGIIHFDFGDSIRSICTTAKEDETNLENVAINLDYYEAYCKGFAWSTKSILSYEEIRYLPLGAKTITFIMGLRILTDYLNRNIYYKVDYETHNLDRAKNQFKLVESIQSNYEAMKQITNNAFGLNNIS